MKFKDPKTLSQLTDIHANTDITDEMIDEALKSTDDNLYPKWHGIELLITLSHYEPPLEFCRKYNGWYGPRSIKFFMKK